MPAGVVVVVGTLVVVVGPVRAINIMISLKTSLPLTQPRGRNGQDTNFKECLSLSLYLSRKRDYKYSASLPFFCIPLHCCCCSSLPLYYGANSRAFSDFKPLVALEGLKQEREEVGAGKTAVYVCVCLYIGIYNTYTQLQVDREGRMAFERVQRCSRYVCVCARERGRKGVIELLRRPRSSDPLTGLNARHQPVGRAVSNFFFSSIRISIFLERVINVYLFNLLYCCNLFF